MAQRSNSGFDQYRGIYLKRIPTYSFPLMLQVMEEHGVAAEQVLKNTGVEAAALSQEDTRMSFLQALKFVRNLIARSPRTDIGLEIGDRYQISTYGVLGYAMMSCSTWGDALKRARHYHRVASSLVQIDMEHDESAGTLTYIAKPFYPDLVDIEPFTVEKLFASLVAVSRPLLARPAMPHRVSFTYDAPVHEARYREIFDCPIEFGALSNRFELDLKVLQQPLLLANEVSAEMGRKMCETCLENYQQADESLRQKVADQLLAGPGRMPDMERVAGQLHMSSRTLRRALQAEGTSFHAVFDEVRHDLSRHYLKNSRLSLDDIAHLVGFTESTNFRRAFKRWQGMPPAKYRRHHVSGIA